MKEPSRTTWATAGIVFLVTAGMFALVFLLIWWTGVFGTGEYQFAIVDGEVYITRTDCLAKVGPVDIPAELIKEKVFIGDCPNCEVEHFDPTLRPGFIQFTCNGNKYKVSTVAVSENGRSVKWWRDSKGIIALPQAIPKAAGTVEAKK